MKNWSTNPMVLAIEIGGEFHRLTDQLPFSKPEDMMRLFNYCSKMPFMSSTSPIERIFGTALFYWMYGMACYEEATGRGVCSWFYRDANLVWPHLPAPKGVGGICAFFQVEFAQYRPDFVLSRHNPQGKQEVVVVECDGHAFHERTAAQASHDKGRDRFLQIMGANVLRFTGSEIVNKPIECAYDAMAIIWVRKEMEKFSLGDPP